MTDTVENPKRAQARERAMAGLAVLVVWGWVFWPVLAVGKTVGFRDSVYMHYPVQKWTTDEMLRGRMPLWSPHDGPGMPVVGEGSTAIFYPLRVLLLLPVCSFIFRYNLFLVLHVLLACGTGYWCARRFGCSRVASMFAGMSFGFSGPVLFQVTNQIFLVGAAWLPVALGCIRNLFLEGRTGWVNFRDIAFCSLAMSMMVLGGDAQMAAMVAMIFAGTIVAATVIGCLARCSKKPSGFVANLPAGGRLGRSFVFVCVVSFLLAAIQILPSADFARYSERAAWVQPRNIYELASAVWQPDDSAEPVSAGSLVGDPRPGTHHDHIYQFSQPPWSLAELMLPGFSGSCWPVNTRWLDGMPGADRMWNVSLYQGGVVFLLAITILFLRKSRLDWWLIGMGFFFCFASFGWYGFGWLVRELGSAAGFPGAFSSLGRPTGGVYWFLVTFVPVFSGFRYPAKLFVISTLCIAVLAGRNLDRLGEPLTRRAMARCILMAIALCLISIFTGLPGKLPGWADGLATGVGGIDAWFGPADLAESARQIGRTLIFGTATGLIAMVCIVVVGRSYAKHLPVVFLLILTVDLAICQRVIVPTIDSAVLDIVPATPIQAVQIANRFPGYRTVSLTGNSPPGEWWDTGSQRRLEQIAAWQIQNSVPRFNLLSGIVQLDFFGSLQPDPGFLPWLPVVISPGQDQPASDKFWFWDFEGRQWLDSSAGPVGSTESIAPRIFAVKQDSGTIYETEPDGKELYESNEYGGFILPSKETGGLNPGNPASSWLKIVDESSGRIVAEYQFESPVVLVMPEGWCGGWQAAVTGQDQGEVPMELLQDGRAGALARIGQGSGKLTLFYCPNSVFAGVTISVISWTVLIGMGFVTTLKRLRTNCGKCGE